MNSALDTYSFSAQPEKSGMVSLRDLLMVVFRHKKKIGLVCAGVFGLTALLTLTTRPVFMSEGKMLIRLGRESLAMDPSVMGPAVTLSQDREEEINSEIHILKSLYLAERVVDRVGSRRMLGLSEEEFEAAVAKAASAARVGPSSASVAPVPASGASSGFGSERSQSPADPARAAGLAALRRQAVTRFTQDLKAEAESRSYVISVSSQAFDPAVAQETLQSLLDVYQERHIQVHRSQATPEFFEEQTARLETTLAQKEDELRSFRQRYDIGSIDRQKEILLAQISDLDRQVAEKSTLATASAAKLDRLAMSLRDTAQIRETQRTTGKANLAVDAIKQKLVELRLMESDARARYRPEAKNLGSIRERIRQAEAALAAEGHGPAEVTMALNPTYQALLLSQEMESAEMKAQTAAKASLEGELANWREKLARLNALETEDRRLSREAESLRDEYVKYRDHLQRARINAALDLDKVSNVSVIQAPTLQPVPVKPKKLFALTLGLVLSLALGLGVAFIAEHLDESFKTHQDIERILHIPALASLSEEEMKSCL